MMKVRNYLFVLFAILFCLSVALFIHAVATYPESVIAEPETVFSVEDVDLDFSEPFAENGNEFWGASNISIPVSEDVLTGRYVKITAGQNSATIVTAKNVAFARGTYVLSVTVLQTTTANITVSLTDSEDCSDINFEPKDVSSYAKYDKARWDIVIPSDTSYKIKITFNRSTSKTFSFDDICLYKLDETAVDEENVITESVVYIRTTAESKGLRFQGKVNAEYYDALCATKTNVKTGMIVAPTDFLSDVEFTVAALSAPEKYVLIYAETFYNQSTHETDGYYAFYCTIKDLIPFNVDRSFSARSFVSYTEDETTKYVYGAYDEELHSKNAYEITANALAGGGLDEMTRVAFLGYQDVIGNIDGEIVSQNGTEYTVRYTVERAGYFTLTTAGNTYSVTSLNGDENAYNSGYVNLNSGAELVFVITVNGDFADFPIGGKIYYK